MTSKQPFDIDEAIRRIEAAVAHVPKAALFALYDEGFRSPFEQLVACMISVRTRDETTVVCARKLFALARTPAEMAVLDAATIDVAIGESTFHESKAAQIRAIAQTVAERYRRRAAMPVRGADCFPRRRAEMRQSGTRHRLWPAGGRCRHPCTPHY